MEPASIRFVRPSRTELHAVFQVTPAQLAHVKQQLAISGRLDWASAIEVRDAGGSVVAVVDKTIAFRVRRQPTAGEARSD